MNMVCNGVLVLLCLLPVIVGEEAAVSVDGTIEIEEQVIAAVPLVKKHAEGDSGDGACDSSTTPPIKLKSGAILPVFVISLPSSKFRRQHVTREFCEKQMPFTFWDATTVKDIDCAVLDAAARAKQEPTPWGKSILTKRAPMNCKEFACATSHKSVYEHMVTSEIPIALVFEDDMLLTDHIRQYAQQLADELMSSQIPWDAVKLEYGGFLPCDNCNWKVGMDWVPFIKDKECLLQRVPIGDRVFMASAYFINLAAAKKVIRSNTPIWITADDILEQLHWHSKFIAAKEDPPWQLFKHVAITFIIFADHKGSLQYLKAIQYVHV